MSGGDTDRHWEVKNLQFQRVKNENDHSSRDRFHNKGKTSERTWKGGNDEESEDVTQVLCNKITVNTFHKEFIKS